MQIVNRFNPLKSWQQMSPSARREAFAGYCFISPWIVGFVVFMAGPVLASFVLSFTAWNIVGEPRWIGLDNYVRILTADPDFIQALKVTFGYSLLYLPISTVCGLAVAMVMSLKLKGIGKP